MEWKNKNFYDALKNSINGIKETLKKGRNFKIQLIFTFLVVLAGIFFKISYLEWIAILIVICIVLFAEMINTVVETIVDMITKEYNDDAKIAKDIAAGAVTICAICSVFIGLIIFGPKLVNLI